MTLAEFIREHQHAIDALIQRVCGQAECSDAERRRWVLNEESLRVWAIAEGVKI